MKVPSSSISVRAQFPELFAQVVESVFAGKEAPQGLALEEETSQWLWNWIWRVNADSRPTKSWSALAKTDAKAHTLMGSQKGFAIVGLEARRKGKRVWTDLTLKLERAPEEIWREIARRANPAWQNSRWSGLSIDIWQPNHQRHPGLAEHALMGALEIDGERHYLLCDRPDPASASAWHVFGLDAKTGVAWPQMRLFDREAQRAFWTAREQGVFLWHGAQTLKVAQAQVHASLEGRKAFAWTLSPDLPTERIPDACRKFKLGDEVLENERRSLTPQERALLGQRQDSTPSATPANKPKRTSKVSADVSSEQTASA